MWYKKVKKFCFVVNFFIWIVIKNYLCDIKSEKNENVLKFIDSKKYEKVKEKVHKQYTHYCVLFCNLTNKAKVFHSLRAKK
jgi:hypothetical protein